MTLRFDERGRPTGLDWAALSASCPQDPSVWSNASLVNTKRQGTKLSDLTEMEIVRLHAAGVASVAIAADLDISSVTVAAVLDRRGVTENRGRGTRQRTPAAVAKEVVRLYTEEQLPGSKVGKLTGVRPATVYKILRRHGIDVRDRGSRTAA